MTNADIVAVTAYEGGTWVPWEEWKKIRVSTYRGKRVHSILWRDGRVWDAVNGFRDRQIYAWTEDEVLGIWEKFMAAKDLLEPMRSQPEVFGDL